CYSCLLALNVVGLSRREPTADRELFLIGRPRTGEILQALFDVADFFQHRRKITEPLLALRFLCQEFSIKPERFFERFQRFRELADFAFKLANSVEAPDQILLIFNLVWTTAEELAIVAQLLLEGLSRAVEVFQLLHHIADLIERDRDILLPVGVAGGELKNRAADGEPLLINPQSRGLVGNQYQQVCETVEMTLQVIKRLEVAGIGGAQLGVHIARLFVILARADQIVFALLQIGDAVEAPDQVFLSGPLVGIEQIELAVDRDLFLEDLTRARKIVGLEEEVANLVEANRHALLAVFVVGCECEQPAADVKPLLKDFQRGRAVFQLHQE